MFKIEAISAKFAAVACTLMLSATMIVGAVGPAMIGSSSLAPSAISRIV